MKIRELNGVNLQRQLGSKWFLLTPISGHFGGVCRSMKTKLTRLNINELDHFGAFGVNLIKNKVDADTPTEYQRVTRILRHGVKASENLRPQNSQKFLKSKNTCFSTKL